MAMRKFTSIFTSFAILLCLFHYVGWDSKSLLLFSFSIPLWFLPIFTDIRNLPLLMVYMLTIASWAVLGYCTDLLVNRQRDSRGNKQ
jgi:hypothetical protein